MGGKWAVPYPAATKEKEMDISSQRSEDKDVLLSVCGAVKQLSAGKPLTPSQAKEVIRQLMGSTINRDAISGAAKPLSSLGLSDEEPLSAVSVGAFLCLYRPPSPLVTAEALRACAEGMLSYALPCKVPSTVEGTALCIKVTSLEHSSSVHRP